MKLEKPEVEEKTVREIKLAKIDKLNSLDKLDKEGDEYIALRNQFAVAVVDYVLKGMDITFLEGHASIPRMAEKVYMLADALTKESIK